MNPLTKGGSLLFTFLLSFLLVSSSLWSQSAVSFAVDQSTTSHVLKKAIGLPSGKSAVVSLTAGNRFICTVLNSNGSVAKSIDFTSELSLQNSINWIEMKAIGTPGGNIFITYTSSTTTGMSNQNAKYLILSQAGAVVSTGNVNASNPGASLNRFFDLAVLSNGNVVAIWLQSDNNSGAFRIFSETGTAITGDVVFAGPGSSIFNSGFLLHGNKVAANPQGGFLVSFYYNGGNFRAIRFSNSGVVQPTGGANAFIVDPTPYAGNYNNYQAIGLANGNYLLCWAVASVGYYKIISAAGADVKAKSPLHADLAETASWGGWIESAAINTAGSEGFAMATMVYQDYDDLANPYLKATLYKYDLSGNFLTITDLSPYYISDFDPALSLYSGIPSGIGVAYEAYKSFTASGGSYTVPADADINATTLGFPSTSTLPVHLVDFQASLQGDATVLLEWRTASEENNKGFLVQRSTDGIHFQSIGEVLAAPQGTSGSRYSWTDHLPVSGLNYYRLMQVDIDGQSKYFSVRSVRISSATTQARIYPNPVTGSRLLLNLNQPLTGKLSYQIIDARGGAVHKGWITNQQQQIPVASLAKGFYVLRLSGGQNLKFEKK